MIFKSSHKNMQILGTSIKFENGVYETTKKKEIELLKKTSSVTFEKEIKEEMKEEIKEAKGL